MATDDDLFAGAVAAVQRVAASCRVPVLLVGAYARDLLLEEWGAKASMRRTRDVDFGVKIGDWAEFKALRGSLIATGEFAEVGRNLHKVKYRGTMEVDLVPFGEIADEEGRLVCWPDEFGQEMNVLGYQEALAIAKKCPVAPMPMVTLPAFVGLKILSWNDGPERRAKDASDLGFVLKNLSAMDAVLESMVDFADEDWQDIDHRCHRWLGTQVGSVFGIRTRIALARVLAREADERGGWRLARQMAASYPKADDARLALEFLGVGLAAAGGGRIAS